MFFAYNPPAYKLFTIFAKIPILYAWLGSEFASDACINCKISK